VIEEKIMEGAMKKKRSSERIIKLKKRMAKTHFTRRGFALFIDFVFIALISVPLYILLFYLLFLFNPEYGRPIENIKRIVGLKSDNKELNPLKEFILKEYEELEKRIARAKRLLEEKKLKPERKQSLMGEIKESEGKLDKIRQRRLEQGSKAKPEQKIKEGAASSTGSIVFPPEGFKWVQEILVAYTYFTLFFFFGRRTPGKRLFGLKVVKRDGSKLSFWGAFERTHGYAYSTSLAMVGFLQVLWDKESTTMHDKIAGTTVIRVKRSVKKREKKKQGQDDKESKELNKG
jgi:uncharacterized RDD family membrane protein YckC